MSLILEIIQIFLAFFRYFRLSRYRCKFQNGRPTIEYCFISVGDLIEVLMEEIEEVKLVVTLKDKFEYRDDSKLLGLFGFSGLSELFCKDEIERF